MGATSDVVMSFPGGRRVVAQVGRHVVETDQPRAVGGEDSAPSPFDLFLASIGACAGFFALTFLQKRGLPTDGLRVTARPEQQDGTLARVAIDVELPPDFPAKYREPLLRSIEQCSVKRAIAAQPAFDVSLTGTAVHAEASVL